MITGILYLRGDHRTTQNRNRRSIRLKGFDYSSNGAYFVTICTKDRQELFGSVVGANHDLPDEQTTMILNRYGKIVDRIIKSLTDRFPVDIDICQIMPNHIHMVIIITGCSHVGVIHESPPDKRAHHDAPLHLAQPQRSLLSQIIGFLKMNSSKLIHQISDNPQFPVWQRNYYEHIIRNGQELFKIRQYIQLNPNMWERDRNNPKN